MTNSFAWTSDPEPVDANDPSIGDAQVRVTATYGADTTDLVSRGRLGVSRPTLYRWLREYGIEWRRR